MNIKHFIQRLRIYIKRRIRGQFPIEELRKIGADVGTNVQINSEKMDLDYSFLLSIGNNVTISSARLVFHDASTKKILGYSKFGRIKIGNNVFIGADAIILPNVSIGNNVIVGAGCVVSKNIPDFSVVVGNPCRVVSNYNSFISKNRELLDSSPVFHRTGSKKTKKERETMKKALENCPGFDI